eukprot:GHRQ01032943.1.p1 GENE.GHRQ01032943.1~~GHRQ01032943.1.p1  ORF type:complete len:211 (+),score=68.48 GHRQ01032943.1:1319-1951(+)
MSSNWQPSGGASASPDGEARCGSQRATMKTNVLISKTELGKVKRTTFNNSSPDTIYGAAMAHDAESARQVISTWQEHVPNPHAKPGPDFRAMNKAAAASGLVSSNQIRTFREGHPAPLKTGVESVTKAAPRLPSDKDPGFTYGKPAAHRTAEEVRNFGPFEPPVKGLVQGAYSKAWVDMNVARQVGEWAGCLQDTLGRHGMAWHDMASDV